MAGYRIFGCLGGAALLLLSPPAKADCKLCAPDLAEAKPVVPISIEIESMLDFSRAAQTEADAGGDIAVDAQSGGRRVSGGLAELGGYAVRGVVRIKGEPGRPIRVDMPTRVDMRSNTGATAEIYGLETNLSSAPRIGADGTLVFSFGGRMSVKGRETGNFRGSVVITADYL